ncbi:hypothetical protein JCM3774_001513 [Rhodotorula dairenensis]
MNQVATPAHFGHTPSHASFSPAPSVVHNHLPLPGTPLPNTPSTGYAQSTISMASSLSSPAMWPPPSPAPYFPPPPAAPAELYDPLSPTWQTSAPPSHPNASHPHYSAATVAYSQSTHPMQQYMHGPTEAARSPAPAVYWDAAGRAVTHSPLPEVSPSHLSDYPPDGAVAFPVAAIQYHASPAPLPPPTSTPSNVGVSQYSPPLPCPSPVPQRRSLDSPIAPATPPPPPPSARSRTPLRTPPPPAPSAAYRPSPTTSPAPDDESVASPSCASDVPGLLETIGEDGESQAGTAKSAMLPSGMTDALRAPGPSTSSEETRSTQADNSPGRSSVQDLEELVEAAEQARERARDESPSGRSEAKRASADKALPDPPAQRPSARNIFARDPADVSEGAVPSPTAPSTSRNTSSSPPKREPGGFAALQARLARSTPPAATALPTTLSPRSQVSRSPSPTKSSLDTTQVGNVSALRARSISRASRYQQAVRETEEQDPREVVQRIRARSGLAPINIADLADIAAVEAKTAALIIPSPDMPLMASAATFDTDKGLATTSPPPSPRRPLPSPPQASPNVANDTRTPTAEQSLFPVPKGSSGTAAAESGSTAQPPRRPVFQSRSPSVSEVAIASSEESTARTRQTEELPSPTMRADEAAPQPKKLSSPSPWSSRAASPWSPRLAQKISNGALEVKQTALDARIESAPAVDAGGRKVVNSEEIKGLKQDAVKRVSSWLDLGDVAPPSSCDGEERRQPSSPPTRYIPMGLARPTSSASGTVQAPSAVDRSDRARSSSRSSAREHPEPTVAQLIAAETRAAMRESQRDRTSSLTSVTSIQRGLNGYLAALEQDASFERDAQAHKSAKAAKPGKVRSVASIWAERVEGADRAPPQSKSPGHKSTKSLSSLPASAGEMSPGTPLATAPRLRPASLYVTSTAERSSYSPTKPLRPVSSATSSSSPASVPSPVTPSSPVRRTFASSPAVPSSPRKEGARVAGLLARFQQQIS